MSWSCRTSPGAAAERPPEADEDDVDPGESGQDAVDRWREARVAALEDANEAGQRGGKGVELHDDLRQVGEGRRRMASVGVAVAAAELGLSEKQLLP